MSYSPSRFLLPLGLVVLIAHAFPGKLYWFNIPFRGTLLATVCYAIARVICDVAK
jgi:hypothetical protein